MAGVNTYCLLKKLDRLVFRVAKEFKSSLKIKERAKNNIEVPAWTYLTIPFPNQSDLWRHLNNSNLCSILVGKVLKLTCLLNGEQQLFSNLIFVGTFCF
jgi:hypothetical protein